jgi:molybdopterin-guanine dinucleotide biosynthesis protein A
LAESDGNPRTPREPITGVILAGGLARRMGRVDKGLQLLDGKPLFQWVAERFAPQVEQLLVNANQNATVYDQLSAIR